MFLVSGERHYGGRIRPLLLTHVIALLLVFALVTDTGHLIIYNINHPERPWEKIGAHGAEASTLDWHPTRPYVIATGGVADRSVKSTLMPCCLCLL